MPFGDIDGDLVRPGSPKLFVGAVNILTGEFKSSGATGASTPGTTPTGEPRGSSTTIRRMVSGSAPSSHQPRYLRYSGRSPSATACAGTACSRRTRPYASFSTRGPTRSG